MNIKQAAEYLKMGRNKAFDFLYSINAIHKVSPRICIVDRKVIDEYFDRQNEENKNG